MKRGLPSPRSDEMIQIEPLRDAALPSLYARVGEHAGLAAR